MARTVVLSEPGTRVVVQNGLLCVTRNDTPVRDFKPHEVDQFVLMGRIELSSAAIALLLRSDIDCVFLTAHGHFRGRLVGEGSLNVPLRVAQYRQLLDPPRALALAKAIVAGKIANQRTLLLRAQRELTNPSLAEATARLRLRRDALAQQNSVDGVMGIEGEASALYFANFGKTVRNPSFCFAGRNRRPPKDPINACLSFGYALLATVIEGSVLQAGMDPLLGALHQPVYGRPSLVLDLMEEFRPVLVDSLVLRVVNRQQVTQADFGPPEVEEEPEDFALEPPEDGGRSSVAIAAAARGVHLKGSGRKVFLSAFYGRLRETVYYPPSDSTLSYRQIVMQQVYRFARVLKGEDGCYETFAHK